MLTKKYFSISEACDMCALAPHKLRYIDKIDKNISIVKIRGRRYYTMENINYLVSKYSDIDSPIINNIVKKNSIIKPIKSIKTTEIDHQIIERIDRLLKNFQTIATRLN